MLPLPAEPTTAPDARLTEPVLYWALRGGARIDVDGCPFAVSEGTALWVPGGRRVTTRLGGADVVVPVPGLEVGECAQPVLVEVPATWRPWLLHAFGEALGHLDAGAGRSVVQRALDAVAPASHGIPAAPPPVSDDLTELARAIAAAPAVPVSELARRRLAGWSPRTLQRRFLAETGLTPEEWARRERIAAAARLLADGHDLEPVAHAVGFATVSGFSRLFRQLTGVSPGRWRAHATEAPAALRLGDAPPPPLPAQRTWPRANGSHVAVWVLRGHAIVTVGGQELDVPEGGAVVLPAGVPNDVRMPEGALMLPVGFRSGRELAAGTPTAAARIAPGEEDDLVQAMVAAYTNVRPPGLSPYTGFDLVHARSARHEATRDDAVLATLASGFAAAAADLTLAACAGRLGLSQRELSRIVNDRTGMTFAQWGRMLRASRARARLHGGEAASVVSRALGYAHLPAFSRAFREVHGRSPQGIALAPGGAGEVGRWHRTVVEQLVRPPDGDAGEAAGRQRPASSRSARS